MKIINLQDHSHRSESVEVSYDGNNLGWAVFEVQDLGYYPAWWDDSDSYGWRALDGFVDTKEKAVVIAKRNYGARIPDDSPVSLDLSRQIYGTLAIPPERRQHDPEYKPKEALARVLTTDRKDFNGFTWVILLESYGEEVVCAYNPILGYGYQSGTNIRMYFRNG